jgi:hypothetical protein
MSLPTGTDLHTSSSTASPDSRVPAFSIANDREGYDSWSRMRDSMVKRSALGTCPELGAAPPSAQGTAGINVFIALAGLALYPAPQPSTLSRHIELAAYTPVALIALWLGCGACGALSTCELPGCLARTCRLPKAAHPPALFDHPGASAR